MICSQVFQEYLINQINMIPEGEVLEGLIHLEVDLDLEEASDQVGASLLVEADITLEILNFFKNLIFKKILLTIFR